MNTTKQILIAICLVLPLFCGTSFAACDSGWDEVDGKCYFFEFTQMPWNEALLFCESLGGYLAEIEDDATESALLDLLSTHSDGQCPFAWIGGNDNCIEGQWGWEHSRTPITTFFWATGDGEPDGGSGQNVMAITCSTARDVGWYDTSNGAGDVTSFVCQKELN